ncbi:MAG: hypothetical protein ABH828_02155 [archaeon]
MQKHENLITGIDRLLDYVNKKEEISMIEASKHLNVPIEIVEHWCETLEDSGFIATRLTLTQKYLMSLEFNKANGKMNALRQHIKSIGQNSTVSHAHSFKEQEQLLQKKMKLLNKKTRQMKNYLSMKIYADNAIKKLTQKEKYLNALEKKLEKDNASLKTEQIILSKEQKMLDKREENLYKNLEAFEANVKLLRSKEKLIELSSRRFEKDLRKMNKNKMVLAKKKAAPTKNEMSLLNKIMFKSSPKKTKKRVTAIVSKF